MQEHMPVEERMPTFGSREYYYYMLRRGDAVPAYEQLKKEADDSVFNDSTILYHAFRRYAESRRVLSNSDLRYRATPEVFTEVLERLAQDDRKEADRAFEQRSQAWQERLQELLGVEVRPCKQLPEGLQQSSHEFVRYGRPGVFSAFLRDGRTIVLEVFPAGHYFAADVYGPNGNYVGGNNDFFWEEFKQGYNIPVARPEERA